MADNVDKTLCDERSGNIQKSLEKIDGQLERIWEKIDKNNQVKITTNTLSTKKQIAIIGGIVIALQAVARIVEAFVIK